MNNSIPRKSRIVDNDMDLAISELGRLGYECLEIFNIRYIACDGDGAAWLCAVDGIRYRICFFWRQEEKLNEYSDKNPLFSLFCSVLYWKTLKQKNTM